VDAATTGAQLAGLQGYFQSTWQPPAALTEPLSYRLVVGPSGSLQSITPLGGSAGTFIDRTGIPLLGEPFVSAAADGFSRVVVATLYPDGGVEVYLEGVQ